MPLIDEILSGQTSAANGRFAVGDWKQMIYGWRGADRDALENALGDYIRNGSITGKLSGIQLSQHAADSLQ